MRSGTRREDRHVSVAIIDQATTRAADPWINVQREGGRQCLPQPLHVLARGGEGKLVRADAIRFDRFAVHNPMQLALHGGQLSLVRPDLGAEIGKEYEDFEVTGAVFEKLIEPTLIQPTFVTHLPKELVPLAKLSPDDPTTVEVFECCINGQEISPGYTEQNDPIAQRATLEHQAGGEQQKLDEDFLVALEHGMPPAGGIGIGIDRLCMMLLGQESIRDVILFPQLKPK